MPTKAVSNVDITNLRFASIERPNTITISGKAHFEGEETVK